MSDVKPKSPFRVLLEQASELGIRRIRFDVDVEDYDEDDTLRWTATAPQSIFEQSECVRIPEVYRGTNGQHALTELVAAKRCEVQQTERKKGKHNGSEKA